MSAAGTQKWRVKLGSGKPNVCTSSPSVAADGTVYAAGADGLYAYRPTGTLKWKHVNPGSAWGGSHPALGGDGTAYYTGLNGVLYAVNSSGQRLWSASPGGRVALGADGTVYVTAGRGLYAYKDGGTGRPTVGHLKASPDPVSAGGALTLQALEGRAVPGRVIQSVSFYLDVDADGVLNPAIDQLVGTDADGSDGWAAATTAEPTAGLYTYLAVAVDNAGRQSNIVSDAVAVSSPLTAPSLPTTPTSGTLSPTVLHPLLAEAARRWRAAGVEPSAVSGLDLRVADLSGTTLGLASGNTIWVDDDAAGWGWFIDPTPWDDAEFVTPGDQGEQGRVDLLSVLMHELGHLLG
ncbi:MAG: PQQ-binding-like beta-propeller repeat protein, partial [Acidimicrobiales bacterium]|nr:PQQ-binding-like beta-propeller repeat protein [Acidimicrobiales bacterium]